MNNKSIWIGLFLNLVAYTLSAQQLSPPRLADAFPFRIEEFYGAVNHGLAYHPNSEGHWGGGLGMKTYFFKKRPLYLTVGLGYTYLDQTIEELYCGRFCSNYSARIQTHALHLPIGLRYEIGERKRLFMEIGVYTNVASGNSGWLDAGVQLGLGGLLPLGNWGLFVQPVLNWGVVNENPQGPLRYDDIFNRYVELRVGLRRLK